MSDCSCSIEYECDDWSDFAIYYKARVVKAFKKKKCCECKEEISVGSDYRLAIAQWNNTGKFDRYHSCMDCASVRKHIFCVEPYDGGVWEELGNYLQECDYDDMPLGCLPYLTPRARKDVCEMIEEQWKQLEELEEDDERS